MATTEQDKANRWLRIIKHQDNLTPFLYWATLNVSTEYDNKKFRQKLGRQLNAKSIKYAAFREQSKRGRQPHFHFLFSSDQSKQDIRQLILACLPKGSRIDLQYEEIDRRKKTGTFAYVSKVDPKQRAKNIELEGRNVFANCWTKPTSELAKLTDEEITNWATSCPDVITAVVNKEVTPEQAHDAQFLFWHHRKIREDNKPVEVIPYDPAKSVTFEPKDKS